MSVAAEWTVRKNTFVGIFPEEAPAISALIVHQLLFKELGLSTADVRCVQLEIGVRQFFVKLQSERKLQEIIARKQVEFAHPSGVNVKVKIEDAGCGLTPVRVFRLPPEVNNDSVVRALSQYGRVTECVEEKWGPRYPLAGTLNGVRAVKIELKKGVHIPSFIKIQRIEVLCLYEGQPPTCRKCHSPQHLFHDCPLRIKNQPEGGRRWETLHRGPQHNKPASSVVGASGASSVSSVSSGLARANQQAQSNTPTAVRPSEPAPATPSDTASEQRSGEAEVGSGSESASGEDGSWVNSTGRRSRRRRSRRARHAEQPVEKEKENKREGPAVRTVQAPETSAFSDSVGGVREKGRTKGKFVQHDA